MEEGRRCKESEWSNLSCSVKGRVIPVFRPGRSHRPLLRLVGGEATQVSFNATIDHLGLAIGLGMICCVVLESGTLQMNKFSPKKTQRKPCHCHR